MAWDIIQQRTQFVGKKVLEIMDISSDEEKEAKIGAYYMSEILGNSKSEYTWRSKNDELVYNYDLESTHGDTTIVCVNTQNDSP